MWRASLSSCQKIASATTRAPRRATNIRSYSEAPKGNQAWDLPKQPPRNKGSIFFKLLGLSVVGVTGVTGYAWYDSTFRHLVEDNVPYTRAIFDDFFSFLPFPALSTPSEITPLKPLPSLSDISLPTIPKSLNPFESKEVSQEPPPSLIRSKPKPLLPIVPAPEVEKPVASTPIKEELEQKKKEEEMKRKEEERKALELKREEEKRSKEAEKKRQEMQKLDAKARAQRAFEGREAEKAAENAAIESILKTSLKEAGTAVQMALEELKSTVSVTKDHSSLLKEAMAASDKSGEEQQAKWEAVTKMNVTRQKAIEASNQGTDNA
uniref:MICOS complex subunit MIC60 n=2 Tax=Capitella teleta TaxID=283909 RepID=X2AK23_CAPTE